MAEEVRADYTELARLAGDVLKAADGFADGLQTARDSFSLSAAAFGNSTAGRSVHQAQQLVAEEGGTAVEHLVEVLEADVDRIYAVAFAYQQADQEAADDLCRTAPRGGPQPC